MIIWWALRDLNPGPRDYESPALTAELRALEFINQLQGSCGVAPNGRDAAVCVTLWPRFGECVRG